MKANSPNQRCLGLWLPYCWSYVQLLVMEEVLCSDPTRRSRYDFPSHSALVLILLLLN